MLLDLRIQNFAIIEDLSLGFEKGLNIITGDTGAGKSILVGALGLILGGRGAPDMIRTGAEEARITASFDLQEKPEQIERIRSIGIAIPEGELIIHRTLGRGKKSRVTVNGDPATVGLLSRIGESMVDIHGQHEHHSLLNQESHIDMIDAFGRIENQVSRYKGIYDRLVRIKSELEIMERGGKERAQRIDFLQYQIQEIDAFAPRSGEEEELSRERKVLRNAERISTLAHEAYGMLYEAEGSLSDLIGQVLSKLIELSNLDDSTGELAREGEALKFRLEDMAHTLRDRAARVEADPERLTVIDERLERLQDLKRKYGDGAEEILGWRQDAEEELKKLLGSKEDRSRLVQEYEEVLAEAGTLALKISESRRRGARKIEKELERELSDLGMSGTRFVVHMKKQPGDLEEPKDGQGNRLMEKGIDDVHFLVSPNIGEEPKSLVRIASGGELSRIMLAIKTVLAGADRVAVLIFDEIDTGIGGGVAEILGRRLGSVAGGRQVICVTHLPQVASQGEVHLHISKKVQKGRTGVKARRLNGEERVEEIARMLGGIEVTRTTMKHAKEMLELSNGL